MSDEIKHPIEIEESDLQKVEGGALLVPAVQKVREAAARTGNSFRGGVQVATGDLNGG